MLALRCICIGTSHVLVVDCWMEKLQGLHLIGKAIVHVFMNVYQLGWSIVLLTFFSFSFLGWGCLPYFLEQVKSSILHCEYAFVTMLVYFGALISMTYMAVVFFSLPGRYEAFWKEFDGVKQVWKNRKELKVEDLGIVTLFGVELYAWFCVGEIVGRGFTITGYKV